MTEQELKTLPIAPADNAAMEKARQRQAELAKPPGSLGKLEDYSIRLAGITGNVKNEIEKCRVIVLAADNGVTAEGSPRPHLRDPVSGHQHDAAHHRNVLPGLLFWQ